MRSYPTEPTAVRDRYQRGSTQRGQSMVKFAVVMPVRPVDTLHEPTSTYVSLLGATRPGAMTTADTPERFSAPYTTANLNTAEANATHALNDEEGIENVLSARHRDCGGACVTISVPTGATSESNSSL